MSESSNPDPDPAPPTHLQPQDPPTCSSTVTNLRQDSDAVTCIVCLIDLPQDSIPITGEYDPVARLVPCNHAMHNSCLMPWMERANSCPICRRTFNQVSVSTTLSGDVLETYPVKDKIQVHQYDGPLFDDQEGACEVCIRGNNGDALLICDDCDRYYHTYCLGLDSIPSQITWYCPGCRERHQAGQLTSGLYAPTRSRTRQALRSGRSIRTVGATRRLQQSHYDIAQRDDRAWRHAWQHLDSDLEFLGEDRVNLIEEQSRSSRARQAARMIRRREVAAAQIDGGLNAFDQQLAWTTPTPRPRTFPHSQQPISEEEMSAWRMFDIAEGIEESPRKRSRRPSRELTKSPVSDDDKPRRKRPRTRRDSQLLDGNNKNGDTSCGASAASGSEELGNTSSTASESYLGSILESIAKSAESTLPDPPPVGVWGIDLSRMRPVSPEPSNAASPRSRPISPVGASPFSPASPPRSRPHSPVQIGQTPFPPLSPTRRTPIASHIQPASARAWESSPSSPPASRACSPIQRQHHQSHTYSSSDREEPGSDDNRGGASSSSDTDSKSNRKERQQRQRQQGERSHPSLTVQDKIDIARMVRSLLEPLYPEKLSKDNFTEINKSVSRKLYQLVEANKGCGVAADKEKWMRVAEEEITNAVHMLPALEQVT